MPAPKTWINSLDMLVSDSEEEVDVIAAREEDSPTVSAHGVTLTLVVLYGTPYLIVENEIVSTRYNSVYRFQTLDHAFAQWTLAVADYTHSNAFDAMRDALSNR